jgi:RND family efflux transporter MFP subunit
MVSGRLHVAAFAVSLALGADMELFAMTVTSTPDRARSTAKGLIMRRCANLFFVAALALAANGCDNSSVASSPKPAPPPAVTAPVNAPARSAPAGDILSVLTVEHQVDITSQRDGLVMSLSHDEGSAVKAGDVLGQIDDRSLQMEIIKANSDLQVDENNKNYKEAELKAKSAALHRQQQLRALGLSSDADLEAAEFEAKAAEYDLHGYEALVESGHAEINRLKLEQDQTRIRAPFSGVVVRRYIREGQAISKGDKCFRVSQLAPLQVQFQVPESSGRRPVLGAPVGLSLVDDSSRALTARVLKVSPTIDAASDSYDVLAQLTGPNISDLRPGMAVRVLWPGPASRAGAAPAPPAAHLAPPANLNAPPQP